ncbi:probable galacturonosyltransferase 11 [Phalaenopsis equestris]|uniref:probable galacturonosyltransferase 11 n=1 Tax=Phalaenopsis equestris TaxID=78828 RepID=UPI0009E42D33|nr:probable galacturonosyltransferase 11 [Phalaenopsis equestris]XP_020591157.1 probable galacturonosyltransferase 11 [Phalaenopsis equestris]
MRRSRRPARRRLSDWIWWILGLFMAGGLLLFVLHHHHQDSSGLRMKEKVPKSTELSHQSFNLTQELLSSTSFGRQLADQMTLSKAYVVIAKEHGNLQLASELSSRIRDCQRLFSRVAVQGNPISLEEAHPIITHLAQLIYRAQDLHYDISTTITTLKNHAQALEERANAATVQSARFGQLAAEALPKSLHCLNIEMLDEWYKNQELRKLAQTHRKSPSLVDTNLYHFCIFSDNVLATSVVVNSTISNADHPRLLVFHIVTDGINYQSMAALFLNNDYKGCSFEIQSVEEFDWLNASYSPLLKQLSVPESQSYYFGGLADFPEEETKFRNPKFVLLLNHLRFYIPEIYPSLERIVFLDDDVVVQKDLTQLFSLDLHGNVNGAVETCLESYHRFYKFLNFSNPLISSKFDPQACAWAFGVNVFDLIAWKKANVTARYHYWQEQNVRRTLWKTGTLPAGLLTFYGLTEPLDRRWHVVGLGYDFDIDDRMIQSAAVLHFSGNMKPWLKLAVSKYKHFWTQYVDLDRPYLRDCIMH